MFHGWIHYFDWGHGFNSYVNVYQRVVEVRPAIFGVVPKRLLPTHSPMAGLVLIVSYSLPVWSQNDAIISPIVLLHYMINYNYG